MANDEFWMKHNNVTEINERKKDLVPTYKIIFIP